MSFLQNSSFSKLPQPRVCMTGSPLIQLKIVWLRQVPRRSKDWVNFITKWRRLRYKYVVNKEGYIIFVTKSLFNKNSATWNFSETLSQLLEFFFQAPSGNANRFFLFILFTPKIESITSRFIEHFQNRKLRVLILVSSTDFFTSLLGKEEDSDI